MRTINIAKRVAPLLLVLVFAVTNAAPVNADWNCPCGAIVHVNYPTTCPVCGRNLPSQPPPTTPPFTPPGQVAPDSSGVTLGVNIYNAGSRVIVQSVVPNTPAQGRLFPNDQLVKGAFRDPYSRQVHRVFIYSPADVTRLKTAAGAGTQVALQVFRPTSGTRNFFVTFAAPGGTATRTYTERVNGQLETRTRATQSAATIREDSTGEAARMLGDSDGGGGAPAVIQPTVDPNTGGATVGGDTAADLLNGF